MSSLSGDSRSGSSLRRTRGAPLSPPPRDSKAFARRSVLESPPPPRAPFFFSGASLTLVAHDDARALSMPLREAEALLGAVDDALADEHEAGRSAVVVGALPFAIDAPVRLFRPDRFDRYASFEPNRTRRAQGSDAARQSNTAASPSAAHFLEAARRAVLAIQNGELQKVVLARAETLELSEAPSLDELLSDLRISNPAGHVYSLRYSNGAQTARTLVGASPELLVSRLGYEVSSAPLAGSAPRSADPSEDRARAEKLARSAKDLHEHRFVVERILDCLSPYVGDLEWSREPEVTSTPTMWHLGTRIRGRLLDPDVTSLRLALALHPTPAVCGTPTEAAARWIQANEGFDRGYFAGALGYEEESGDGEWVVAIRCAELSEYQARIFAGAGIVGSSDAESELRETAAKMQTILRALGGGEII